MHELGITQNIVSLVSEAAAGRRVTRLCLEIGKLSAVSPEAIRFCFDVCAEGTDLQDANVEINEIDGKGRCNACGREVALEFLVDECDCGSLDIRCIAGEELNIKEIEVI